MGKAIKLPKSTLITHQALIMAMAEEKKLDLSKYRKQIEEDMDRDPG